MRFQIISPQDKLSTMDHEPRPRVNETTHDWIKQASCADILDPEIFYPGRNETSSLAKKFCAQCPVQQLCLDAAMGEEEGLTLSRRFGIRGGLTAAERARRAENQQKAS